MLFPPKFKERYEIREELGAGGMGAVYRAYDKNLKSEVALKTILDVTDPQALRMFQEECKKLALLVHPNIVDIRDSGEFDNGRGKQPFLVMPLLRGATLDELLKDSHQRLSVERVVDILSQACRGLQAAHDAGIIHRDLKPSNIFVLDDDSVKLIDFGVAQLSSNTRTTGRKGTLLFMSPEQIQMKGVSPASDIFSLGVVAYQALSGRNPFERRTEEELVQAVLTYVPPPASEYNPGVSLPLSQTVHKAMAKQPSSRYRNAREFSETLQKAVHGQPIEIFNPARIQPRVDRANQALDKGDLELASEIVGELETEGHFDPQFQALQRQIDQRSRSKRILKLLEGARSRLEEREYPLALQKIQEALEIDKDNSDALALKESIESRRADQSVNDWLQLARQHTDNFAYDRAREAINNVLQLKPNDTRALTMRTEVDRRRSEYEKILREKEKLHQAAETALGRGEVSSALSKMDRVLELDKEAPDRSNADRSTAYQSFYNKIRSEHDSMQNAYTEARALQATGDFSRALAICSENLLKHPGHALLQALKLDLEVSQRQELSGFIAEVDRRVDSEPDLDKRLSILKDASNKFPGVEHFQTNYRLASEKRNLIESIVSKAHVFEEQSQFGEAMAQWEILRSIYDRYPGLEFEFLRLRKRRDHQAKSEMRARCLEKIEQALESNQHARALELLEDAQREFPGDADLANAEEAAHRGAARVAEAEALLTEAGKMREAGRLGDAAGALHRAYTLDKSNSNVCEALQSVLIEQARGVVDTDWRAAGELLRQAQDLGSGNHAVKGLLREVADRRREEDVADCLSRARAMQASGDLHAAYALTTEKLKIYPNEVDLQQLHNRLKKHFETNRKQDLDEVRRLTEDAETNSDPAFLKTVLDKASNSSSRYPEDEDFQTAHRRVRERLMTIAGDIPANDGGVGESPRIVSVDQPKRPVSGVSTAVKSKRAIWVGAATASVLLLAAIPFFRRHPPPPPPPPPHSQPGTLTVHTTPAGATLVIKKDGKMLGDQPELSVLAGNLTIEASLPGYHSVVQPVSVANGEKKTVEIALQLLPPSIRIETTLNAGQVVIDGKPAGDLQGGQYAFENVPEGMHKLVIRGEHEFGFDFKGGQDEIPATALKTGIGGTLVVVGNARGRMQLICNRSGLTLMLDDQPLGTCAVNGAEFPEVKPGSHKLEVMDGKVSLGVKTIELGPATSLSAYLLGDSDQGMLTVTANVEDFNVNFDKRESTIPGKRNKWNGAFKPGDHIIFAHKEGYTVEPASATVSVEKGKNAVQAFTFTVVPVTGSLRITSEPGADVFLDGRSFGKVPGTGTVEIPNLRPGPMQLQIRKAGYSAQSETVQILAGQTMSKALRLIKEPVHITLTVNPSTAKVFIARDGETPKILDSLNTDLEEGNYTFRATAPNYKDATDSPTLVSGTPYNHAFTLERAQSGDPGSGPKPKPLSIDWSNWTLSAGYYSHKSGVGVVAVGIPSTISFTATWKGSKFNLRIGNSLQWDFVGVDRSGQLNFKLDDKGILSWAGKGKAAKITGRQPSKGTAGEHTVRIDSSGPTIQVTVDGEPVPPIDFDIATLGTCNFQFRISAGETLSVREKDFVYKAR